ncbi:hypothetical protein F4781DRAFT_23023 [Annulohypoxylon bovei var. microspora]|nr:hypothetical protein F4781DRAFT_23023 [Annulohypoxylon bovei var. microspora]
MYPASAVARQPTEGHAGPDAFVTHVPDYPVLRGPGCGLGSVSDPALPQPFYNSSGAPYPGVFASANLCCFRPQSPSSLSEVNMSARPSSSRGPGSKSSASNSFKYDKRISRDDSFINSRTAVGAGFRSYNNFARGQLPTPEISPRTSPPRKVSVPTIRMPTPESLNETSYAEIGMALGSPTSIPVSGGSRTPQTTLRAPPAPTPSLISPASGISSAGSLPRKQSTKWKLFGRFGRKASDQSLPGPIEPRVVPKLEETQDLTAQAWYDSNMQRSNTVGTHKLPKHKPIVIRSQTMPHDAENPPQGLTSTSSGKRAEENFGRIPIALDTNQGSCGPLLDVEIPSITMERYSVMFGSVLQSQPSLLARRQATVQKLKSIEDAVEREEEEMKLHDVLRSPRRATSPATGSPSFALFPPPRPIHAQTSNPSPLSRSNTSPALLRSPLKAAFDHTTPNHHPQSNDVSRHNHLKESPGRPYPKGKLTIATLARAREQHAAPREYQFSPDSSNLVLESPTEMSSPEFEVVKPGSIRPRASYMQEPKWQMMTPQQDTPSTASSSLASDRKPPPSSPATSANSKLSLDSKEEDDLLENSSNMNPVELSIARQISISRQQRKMLRPLQTGARPQRSPGKLSPMPKIAMGQNERLAETKLKTPILVTPEETTSNYNFAAHRKSERVVLEGA